MNITNELLIQLKSIYSKYKLIIIPTLTGISSVIILVLIIIPQFTDYLGNRGKIVNIRNQLASLEVKAQELEQIDGAATEKNLQTAFTILPVSQDILSAMVVLQSIIGKSGLTLQNTGYIPLTRSASSNNFQLTVTVLGDLLSLRNFLLNLQNSPLIFQVESINTRFPKDNQIIEAEIPLSVHYEPSSNKIGALDQPAPKLDQKDEALLEELSRRIAQMPIIDLNVSESSSGASLGKPDPFE